MESKQQEQQEQQERPAEEESFGGEQAAMAASSRTSSWLRAQCCRGLCDYFLKAPPAPAAIPPPEHKVAGAAEEGSRVGDKKLESFQFDKNQNRDRGNGQNGGIKN